MSLLPLFPFLKTSASALFDLKEILIFDILVQYKRRGRLRTALKVLKLHHIFLEPNEPLSLSLSAWYGLHSKKFYFYLEF
jgi:hypothetical protein